MRCSKLLHGYNRCPLHRDGLLRLPQVWGGHRRLSDSQPANRVRASPGRSLHVQCRHLLLVRAPVLRGDGYHRTKHPPSALLRASLSRRGVHYADLPQYSHL